MARKGENIYKRKDGRWEGRYLKRTPDGKSRYGYVYARTYKDAKSKLRQAAGDEGAGAHLKPAGLGMAMEVAAIRGQLRRDGIGAGEDGFVDLLRHG